jgi:hypothetical protein
MRLKVSPKEALLRIDKLVLNGDVTLCDIRSRYDEKHRLWEKKMNDPEHFIERSQYIRIGPERTLTDEDLDEYHEKAWAWEDKAEEELRDIYMDHVPVFVFLSTYPQTRTFDNCPDLTSYFKLHDTFRAKLHLLATYYKELQDGMKSPLSYLSDQAKICFYDFICPLTADTNEALLCSFMFGFSVGEKVEMEDIFAGAFHGNKDEFCGKDREVIKHAYDGINRKTNDAFGFPILKKDGTTLCLTLPSRVTSNLA